MEIKKYNVIELNHEEMIQINGGGAFLDCIRRVLATISNYADMFIERMGILCAELNIESLFVKDS